MTPAELEALRAENAELRARLDEAEETLAAIRSGEVDALIVGDDIYTLESANATSNRLRKDVLAQMQDAVVALDGGGHIVYLNPAAERQYGMTASQALGHPRHRLFEEQWPSAKSQAQAQRALQRHGSYRAHTVHRRRDGITLHVESSVSRLQDGDKDLGSLAVIRDISERQRAEAAVRAAALEVARRERQFATLVENSPDITTRFDRELRHLYVSPTVVRYTGLTADRFIGKTNRELNMPEALCERWEVAQQQVFATGEIGRIGFHVTTPDGDVRFLEARLIPERGDDGSVESVMSIAADVTERERAEAALRDADRHKDEFIATLAHELRNPLAPIRNAVEIMRLTRDPARHEQARGVIDRQLRQIVHLVDDLLDVSRITQGKVVLRRERIDLAAMLQNAVETSRPLIEANRHRLALALPAPGALTVDADMTRLTQIVANLLNNAAKYTPEGGAIAVSAQEAHGEAVITVQDSGVGIPPQLLPHVFDMFAQIDRTLERAQGGLGIGLALVKKLVEMHGGAVEAHSDGPGRGSRFVVRLPLLAAGASPEAPAGERAAPVARAAARVLVVDDNVDSAQTLATMLGLLGYATAVAHDGLAAVDAVRGFQPHIVMLDIGMPRLNGHEAARRIRLLPGGDQVRLIALSGWGQEHDRRKSREAGFDTHLVKPLHFETLTELLGSLGEAGGTGAVAGGFLDAKDTK